MRRRAPRRRFLHGRGRDGAWQLAVGLSVFAVYLLVTKGLSPDVPSAISRGLAVARFESWLHIDVESSADHWLAHQPVLGWLSAWEYATTYIVTTFAVAGWLWWRRPADYRWGRNTLIWSTLLAIACFGLWPVAPPRLLPTHGGSGFVDIVARYHPILSWGGGTVSAGADQYAAMPSLHVGWAVWVTVVTLRARASRLGWSLAVLHLAVTVAVVIGTGNHWVLDVIAGALLVAVAVGLEQARRWLLDRPRRLREAGVERVAAPDEFFLHVESATDPQPVGGFVLLDTSGDAPPTLADLRALIHSRLAALPRFQQRIEPAGRLRHARWVRCPVDIDWHIREHRLPSGSGWRGLEDFIGVLAEQHLDRSRPLWQVWLVPEVTPGRACAIGVMHHTVADGLGVVDILRQLMEPKLPMPDLSAFRQPGPLVRTLATAAGVVQLAVDGRADQLPVLRPLSGRRRYRTALTPFEPVRQLARRMGTTVTDVLLAALGQALADVLAARGEVTVGRFLRAAVPVTTRIPAPPGTGRRAEPGNITAALRLDVPLDPMPPLERLLVTAKQARRRRRSGRGLAAAAVMRVLGVLPPSWHARAARGIYTSRYVAAIVSNMPGPTVQMSVLGREIGDTYPILPLAERVPLGVGTLGWNGEWCLSVLTDAEVLPEADSIVARMLNALLDMQRAASAQGVALPDVTASS